MTKTKGGKAVYGAPIGILMLEARFPRIPGDMGNAGTWPFPVRYKVVRGASPDLVVRRSAAGLLPAFIEAGQELVDDGVELVTTNCGFLSLFQMELSEALDVPVVTSALIQAAPIQAMLPPGRSVGILTISRETLTDAHLDAVGVPDGTPIWGVRQGCEFQRVLLDDEDELDVEQAGQDMVNAAMSFVENHPDLGAILFECTNMPPYSGQVRDATSLPVFSIESCLHWVAAAL